MGSTTTITIKDINSGKIYPIQVDRILATYGKINRNYIVEWKQNNETLKIPFSKFRKIRLAEAQVEFDKKKISAEQFLNFTQRMKALDLSYVHATIGDIIEENDEYVTVAYHVITTKCKPIDYGGPNRFTPMFLWNDETQKKDFFAIPVTFLHKMRRIDYQTIYSSRNDEVFKDNSIELKDRLSYSLNKLNEYNVFKLLDVNKYCLEVSFSEINTKEELPYSTFSKEITGIIDKIET